MLPPVPVLKTACDTARCGGGDPHVIGSPLVTSPGSLGRLYLADLWGVSHALPLSARLQDTDLGHEKAEGFLASAFSKYKPKLKQAVGASHTKVICERGALGHPLIHPASPPSSGRICHTQEIASPTAALSHNRDLRYQTPRTGQCWLLPTWSEFS